MIDVHSGNVRLIIPPYDFCPMAFGQPVRCGASYVLFADGIHRCLVPTSSLPPRSHSHMKLFGVFSAPLSHVFLLSFRLWAPTPRVDLGLVGVIPRAGIGVPVHYTFFPPGT